MIANELKALFDDLKNDIMLMRTDMTLISFDIEKMREQLDRIEQQIKTPPPPPMDMSNWHVEKL